MAILFNMRLSDIVTFCSYAVFSNRLRTSLLLLAMAIGVAAIIVLTGLGESARLFVVNRFASLGTNLVIVLPGRSETTGGHPPLLGETPQDLTLDDAHALARSRHLKEMAPIVVGNAPVAFENREREVSIMGTTASFLSIRRLAMVKGHFLPLQDLSSRSQVCVLGARLATELLGPLSELNQIVRIGAYRFRVIGILASEGVSIGVDLDDVAFVPVAAAMGLFNTESLFRIMAEAAEPAAVPALKEDIIATLRERHNDEDDITIITQDAVIASFDRIFKALTLAVAGIAATSLVVAGILIMNVMLVTVSQRTAEIGLLKALGATARQILIFFLTEALFLSLAGALAGCLIAVAVKMMLERRFGDFPIHLPFWTFAAAIAVALATSLLFAWLPARRAAALEPVTALSVRK